MLIKEKSLAQTCADALFMKLISCSEFICCVMKVLQNVQGYLKVKEMG